MTLAPFLLSGLASLLAPPTCAVCRRGLRQARRDDPAPGAAWRALLCAACRRRLELVHAACRACGRPLGPHADAARRCRSCAGVALGGVDTTTALLRYRGAGRALLRRLKYGGCAALAAPLGRALGARLLEAAPDAARDPRAVVVAVPLHPLRHLSRGFNQAHLLALGVAAVLERPLVPALRRARSTRALYGVARGERDAVVRAAFVPRRAAGVAGRTAILVDDIRTSGATLRAAAAALRAAGATHVHAAVVAR